jgi:UDPglucose 6-dehydrogenase
MNIAVFGSYLKSKVSAALFASVGNQVYIFNDSILEQTILDERDLNDLYATQKQSNRLIPYDAKRHHSITFSYIIVADILLSSLFENWMSSILPSLQKEANIIYLTPTQIGESEQAYQNHLQSILKNSKKTDFYSPICCAPLLIREGRSLLDFSRPDSLILGCDHVESIIGLRQLFYPFNRVKNVIKIVSTKEAEFSYFVSNAMLATRLSFMNEMAELAESVSIDIDVIRKCIGMDPRIGKEYLYPGCGYGGPTLNQNLYPVVHALKKRTDDLGLLDIVMKINKRQKETLFRKIWSFFQSDLKGKHIAIWGAAFKPGTSSIVQAPAIDLIDALIAQEAHIQLYDPLAHIALQKRYDSIKQVKMVSSRDEALIGCDVLAICTEWKEFWSPNFEQIKSHLHYPAIFDGRNLYPPDYLKSLGILYFGIGRGNTSFC